MGIASFLNPWLLAGMAFLAAPIIIHILNKRRFQIHEWAAMEFLLQAVVTNRRRIKMEDLILLLLRIALLALLILAVSRPVAKGLSRWREDERIVVLDDSFSMDAAAATGTVFESARESSINQIQDALGGSASVSLVLGTRPEQEAARAGLDGGGSAEAPGSTFLESGRRVLEGIRAAGVCDLRLRFDGVVRQLVERARAAKEPRSFKVILASDFRKADWIAENGRLPDALQVAFEELRKEGMETRTGFQFVDVGKPDAANTAVAGIEVKTAHVLAGVPVKIAIELQNLAAAPRPRLAGSLEIGPGGSGKTAVFKPAQRIPLPAVESLAPGERKLVEIQHTFDQAGQYLLRAAIDKDALPRDDESFAVVTVREALNVAVLDGDPGSSGGDRFAGESGYLIAAISPRGKIPSGIRAERSTGPITADLLKNKDVLVILNHVGPSLPERDVLAQFLADGGGILYFLGSRVDPPTYQLLGKNLFPAALKVPRSSPPPAVIGWDGFQHPALEVFKGLEGTSIEKIAFAKYLDLEPEEGARVVARFKAAGPGGAPAKEDGTGAPAILESSQGPGKVVIFNTTADRDWSDWPADPSYPICLMEWIRHLAPRRDAATNLLAGEEIRWKVTPGKRYTITPPRGDAVSAPVQEGRDAGGIATAASFGRTETAGFYRLDGDAAGSDTVSRWFAFRRPPAESNLEPLREQDLAGALAPLGIQYSFGRSVEVDAFNREQEGEMWRWLAWSAGLVLFLELFFAWWFGRR